MVDHFGLDVVQAYMRHVQDNAEESVRRVITALNDGAFEYALDNGAVIQVRDHASTARRAAPRSTSPARSAQLQNNFNAPSAVCVAAVLYVFRTLVDDEIPLNAGCLKPLDDRDSARLDAQPATIRPRSSPATSRPRPASPTRCTARSA